ncbi:hypothetical protein IJX73_00120 [bacterium]|nr:hypothetical protein [bacterium]MBQ9149315.1 hypothetical protein [bacterium]
MKSSSTYKLLFLLNILSKGCHTKNQIIKKFESNNLKITKSLITNYINKFVNNNINIKTKINEKREKVYYLENNDITLNFSQKELSAISDVKKLLVSQKNYTGIRKSMRLFYKLARYIKNEECLRNFINFGYYSTINWHLVRTLENHCKEKDVITIDYILPQGGNKLITIHVDSIKISEWSERLYLHGILKGSNHFSHLPIDRIFMIKKVEQRNVRFNLITDILTYIVDSDYYKEINKDERERTIKYNKNKVAVQRPIDDEFYIIQRLLYFCPKIYHISDSKIKMLLKDKLEQLKSAYDNKYS